MRDLGTWPMQSQDLASHTELSRWAFVGMGIPLCSAPTPTEVTPGNGRHRISSMDNQVAEFIVVVLNI